MNSPVRAARSRPVLKRFIFVPFDRSLDAGRSARDVSDEYDGDVVAKLQVGAARR